MEIIIKFIEESAKQSNILPILTLLTSIFVPLGVGWMGFRQITKEFKNNIYEKRLGKIYAKAYSIIVKQEKLRELLGFNENIWDLNNYPILSISSVKQDFINNQTTTTPGTVHTDHILKLIEEDILPNSEFASPNLLNLVNEYLIVLEYEKRCLPKYPDEYDLEKTINIMHTKLNSGLTKAIDIHKEIVKIVQEENLSLKYTDPDFIILYNATTQKVNIENELIIEIIGGYEECLTNLKLRKKSDKNIILKWTTSKGPH